MQIRGEGCPKFQQLCRRHLSIAPYIHAQNTVETAYKDCWGAAPVREGRKQPCSRNAGQTILHREGETVIEDDGGGK